MKFANIELGSNVEIDPSTSINNVIIRDNARIAKQCSIYGGPDNQLEIGENVYIGMHSILNGFAAKLVVGKNTSISQYVNMMVDSGPNASPGMQQIYPLIKGPIIIGNDCWIGANANIMPNVTLGEYCVVASNSFVNKSYPAFSIIGGTPAKLIRSFTDSEKEKMLSVKTKGEVIDVSHYESNYKNLPFEDILRQYRKKKLFEILDKYPHKRILEIGCGSDPLFGDISDFDKMVVVEPAHSFFKTSELLAQEKNNVSIINDVIENVADGLIQENFDFIIIGGFLHEVPNPDEILQAINKLCTKQTIIYSIVPNAKSFHRLLAYKMGAIESIYDKSAHDNLFDRQKIFDIDTCNKLFTDNNFIVMDSGSYFVKLFSHDQMNALLSKGILNSSSLDGLDKMIEFMPGMGAELFNICKIND